MDRAVNTVLRDDRGGDNPNAIQRNLKQIYEKEAYTHPGVNLVAGSGVYI